MTSAPTERCSRLWSRDDLPAWGTASRGQFWVGLEQRGPWGAKPLTQSRLDPEVGAALDARVSELGGRIVLIRRPGRHVDEGCATPRTVLVSGGMAAGAPWMGETHILDPHRLLDLLDGFTPETRPDWLEPADPALLVCTNGRRDQCCALEGRELVTALAARHDVVWEASHLGGHRFAPTAVVMPTGQARVTVDLGLAALDAAARHEPLALDALHDRGLSHLEPADQVLDSWSRHTGRPTSEGTARRLEDDDTLPSSCGAAAIPIVTWAVDESDA